jgi:cytochrome c biogenesis protein CcmG, thiol:disulfide interchange protein DsbE
MTRSSRESRREAARAREAAGARQRWLLPAIAVAVVVLAAGIALFLSNDTGGGSSERPSDLPSASAPAGGAAVISGTPLPVFQSPASDPAVGAIIPEVTTPEASITADGTAKLLLFLAHWCPHCQAEVPVVQDWVDAGSLPADVELISVSTAIAADRPNYPPDAWLEGAGWTAPVIEDPTGSVADAYGLSAFPFWVFVNADGTVAGRLTGELTAEQLDEVVVSLQR